MATVSKPPSLPPYPEMIFAAIDAEKEGLNKTSIWRFIESTYGELPAGDTNLFLENLNKMKENGDLVFVKNNYMRPDPNAPAKRGRGRPPKEKDTSTPALQVPATVEQGDVAVRGRGRPKKDPNAPSAAKKAKPETHSAAEPAPSKSGRPRGRPRKTQPELAQNGV